MTAAVSFRPPTEDGSWAWRGVCAQPGTDPDVWSTLDHDATRRDLAIHLCVQHCPALAQCDDEARAMSAAGVGYQSMVVGGVAYDSDGRPTVYGFEAESCRLCPAPPRHRSRDVSCGSNGGYQRHRRKGETPCGPCADANAAYDRQRDRTRRRRLAERGANK